MTEVHRLKTLARYYDAVERGEKTFEVRQNDRAFQTGDVLELVRIPEEGMWLRDKDGLPKGGPRLRRRISYLLQGGQFGIEPAYCILGLAAEPTRTGQGGE